MKKFIACCLLLIVGVPVFAQTYEMRNFDIPERKTTETLTEKEKGESIVLLNDDRTYEFARNPKEELELFYSRYVRVHINEQSMVEAYNKIYIPVASPEDLVTLHARTIRKDGKSFDMLKGDMKLVNEEGQNYMILAVEGLEKDAELEYFFTTKDEVRVFLTERLQTRSYSRKATLNIISPEYLIFEVKTYNGNTTVSDTVKNEKRWVTVTSGALNPLDDDEKYSYYSANVLRAEIKLAKNTSVGTNRMYTWDDAGGRFYEVFHARDKSDPKEADKLISKIGLKNESQENQVRKIEQFMKANVMVNENNEEETIKLMLSRKYGSTNQIIKTYILLFEKLNIPYELVITCNRSGSQFDADFDTWSFLDEYFFYFPFSNKYMDPTNIAFRYGFIPALFMDNNGLFIKNLKIGDVESGVSSVKRIEPVSGKLNFDNMNADITLSADNSKGTVKINREMNGYADNTIRAIYFYSNEEDRKKVAEEFMKSCGGEGAEVNQISAQNFDMNSDEMLKPFVLKATVESTGLVEEAGNTILFKIGQVIGQQMEMYQEHARQNPIDLDYAHNYRRTLNFSVPAGYQLKGLEKLNMNITTDDKSMGFISSYKMEGDKLVVTVDEYYNVTRLPVSAYEPFRKVINAAADFNKIKLVLEKK